MSLTWWRYTRRFRVGDSPAKVVARAKSDGLATELHLGGRVVDSDQTPLFGPEAVRNHRLAAALPDGRRLEVEAGYISVWSVGIAASIDGVRFHESHPGRTIAYPEKYRADIARNTAGTWSEAMRGNMSEMQAKGYDPRQLRRNKVPLLVDIVLGLLFFVVAKLTDLSTAALVGAGAGLALVVAQRFVKVDLLGGLALFGIFMLLVSAGLALAFQDDMAVKMRSTIVGLISAAMFLGDGLLGGNRLGKAFARYVPYNDIDPARLALGMGIMGVVTAALNYAVARLTSTDVWLFYTTFGDFVLIVGMVLIVFSFARGRILPEGYKAPQRAD